MVGPLLFARAKKGNFGVGVGINGRCGHCFTQVAIGAGEAKVVWRFAILWPNVFDMQCLAHVNFGRETIFTAAFGAVTDHLLDGLPG